MAAPRGISQPPTSFIGSQCQGIHHAPLNTYNTDKPNKEKNCTSNTHNKHPPTRKPATISCVLDARNHYPQIKHHTPPPKMEQQHTPSTPETNPGLAAGHTHQRERSAGPVVSKPNSVSGSQAPTNAGHPNKFVELHQTPTHYRQEAIQRIVQDTEPPRTWAGLNLVVLLRKEVIQPHLPVRLPCYDFVPIADPTFDGSLPQGVRPPASGVTDFHDVTGGVYKARERIHRSVADLRLLATPTSRGRVADPDPN